MKCLTKDCNAEGYRRGCCATCINKQKTLVNQGKATWSFLELCGEVLPRAHVTKKGKL